METIATRKDEKRPTAFRLNADLVARLKVLAKKDNRSLNNYVENVLMSIAYNEPNETTRAAIRESMENKSLETFDFEDFKKHVAEL